jgi:hypothetical protein
MERQGFFVELLVPWRVLRFVRNHGLSDARNVCFGLSETAESAMEKVEAEIRSDPEFAMRWRGGAFRPVPYHLGIHLKKDGTMGIYPDGKTY